MAHPLRQFIDETADTVGAFARRVGVTSAAIEAILVDEETPDPALARRIAGATGGAISFDQLMNGRETVIADISGRMTADTSLDLARLSAAIGGVLAQVAPPTCRIPRLEFDIAAEAVAHTYAALACVTTVKGEARLAQALRPVLQEILKDHGALPRDPAALEAAALAATENYYRI